MSDVVIALVLSKGRMMPGSRYSPASAAFRFIKPSAEEAWVEKRFAQGSMSAESGEHWHCSS